MSLFDDADLAFMAVTLDTEPLARDTVRRLVSELQHYRALHRDALRHAARAGTDLEEFAEILEQEPLPAPGAGRPPEEAA